MSNWTVHVGDVLATLPTLVEKSVRCCVTSPPYWGLRDYGTGKWEGGDAACNHKPNVQPRKDRERKGLTGGMDYMESQEPNYKGVCGRCGARRIDQQIGIEPTPDEYIARMVAVFRAVRRVLADDGTLWVNMGDGYTSGGRDSFGTFSPDSKQATHANIKQTPRAEQPPGLKPKDLIGMPWLLAFALRADGWYLRSDIIWHKPNPMPESVTDRPTKSHEYVFLLSKQERYFYDGDASSEAIACGDNGSRFDTGETAVHQLGRAQKGPRFGGKKYGDSDDPSHATKSGNVCVPDGRRNKRTVWTIPTQPYKEAHFATFPEKLVEPCILAGSAIGDTVLDPFNGSGTTGAVAVRHGRNYVGIELNTEYAAMARRRIGKEAPLFVSGDVR